MVRIGETESTLRSLLSYAYTGRAEVCVGNALEVLKAARHYLVSGIPADAYTYPSFVSC